MLLGTLAGSLDDPYDLMTGRDRRLAGRQLALDHVQIRPADSAGTHSNQHLRAGRLRLGHVRVLERISFDGRGLSENAGFHSYAL